jgi:hypothetical protein
MTIHFSQFDDSPPALEELSSAKNRQAGLKDLTGCQIARAIDGHCTLPECQSHGLQLNEVALSDETCKRLAQAVRPDETAATQPDEEQPPDSLSSGIFHTDNRLRCVL